MASVNYLGRNQLDEIHTQEHTMLGRNLDNDVYNIDIYLWCLHSKHLTSTSDVSQKSTTSDRRHW